MKLLRYGPAGHEKPGMWDGSQVRDLSAHVGDIGPQTLGPDTIARLASLDADALPVVQPERIGCALADVPNFHCVGLNYRAHAAEVGQDIPSEPVLFSKATSCLAGPTDDIRLPRGSTRTDWEIELGIVIGTGGYDIPETSAMDHVAGFVIVNDLSERSFQFDHGGQWGKGKSSPGFGPVGPWLVTPDELNWPLRLSLSVNDTQMQVSDTNDMIFSVPFMVSYLSRFMTLRAGDLIATGTPPGVGVGRSPQQFLAPGDQVVARIDGLGEQRQTVV